jgi:hypothetical protein
MTSTSAAAAALLTSQEIHQGLYAQHDCSFSFGWTVLLVVHQMTWKIMHDLVSRVP